MQRRHPLLFQSECFIYLKYIYFSACCTFQTIHTDMSLLWFRVANYCLKLAGEQEKVVSERWLPELRNAVQEARRCFEDCQRVRGLVSE
jgi:hypothetical protein